MLVTTRVCSTTKPGKGSRLHEMARKGTIKKTELSEFANIRPSGINAMGIDDGDEFIHGPCPPHYTMDAKVFTRRLVGTGPALCLPADLLG